MVALDRGRTDRWRKAVENLNFAHSSHSAWQLLKRFESRSAQATNTTSSLSPTAVAKRLRTLSKSKRETHYKKTTS